MTNALRLGKKAFTWSVVVTTIVWSMGLAALMPLVVNADSHECPTLEAGDLFKVAGNSAVYLLNADMNRLYFPHSSVYQTWYEDFSGVVEIPNTCVDAYPAPSSAPFGVNYRPGSRLVKVQISPSVYVVEPGNQVSKVGSEAVASSLYGSGWAGLVSDIADPFWPNYAGRGDEITEAVPHNGMLVSTAGSTNVYRVVGGMLKKVDGTVRGDVRTVSQSVFDSVGMSSETVTAASVYADPTEGAGGVSGGDGDGDGDDVTAAGTVTISLAADTPNGKFAVDGAARVPFTKLNFTASGGDVVIKSFKVIRGGSPAVNGDFSKINVIDSNGNLLNDAGKTLNSDNDVTFTEDLKISSGQTKTWTLVADMASAVLGGNRPTLGLLSVDTDSTVVGSLPMYGNTIETNTNVSLGTVTLAQGTNLGSVTKQVGTNDVELASLKVTVATNDFQVERIVFRNASTTDNDDVQNFELRYNNNKIGDGTIKNKYVTFDLTSCVDECKIKKGNNKTYAVFGDLVGGSGRTIDLDIQRTSHVLAKDLKEGYYVTPTNNAGFMTNGVEISQGKINITKSDVVKTGNIPEAASGVELGSFNFKVTGEPIDVTTVVMKLTVTGTVVPTGFDQVTLYERVNGVDTALTGGVDAVGAASPGYATSTDTFTLGEGDHQIIAKGNIDSTPALDDTLVLAIDMSNTDNFAATGVDSGETITLGTFATPKSAVSGNTLTIKTASLRVTHLSTPATTTYAAGVNDVVLADVLLDGSGSSEDMKVTQFKIKDFADSGAKTIDIQNIRLFVDKDGDSFNGSGSQVALTATKNGSDSTANNDEAFTFNLSGADQILVKAGKKVVVTVKGNIAGGAATGNHVFRTTLANDVTATGVSTGNEVVEITDTGIAGTKVGVGTSGGTIEVVIDPSNVSAKNYAAGTTGVTLATFNLLASTTENVELDKIYFTQRVTDTSSAAYQDYALLYVVDEAGVTVGSVVPTSTKPLINFDDGAFIVKTDDTDGAKLTLKANLSSIGPSKNVTVGGHRLGFNIAAAADVIGKGAQTGAGSTEYFGSSSPNGNTHFMYKGVPTIEVLAIDGKLAASADMFKFKVSANTADIGLFHFTFDIATSSVNLTQLELYDTTESNEVLVYSSSTIDWSVNQVIAEIYMNPTTPADAAKSGGNGLVERTVAVSQPRTFVLRGTFTNVGSGDSVTTRLAGDSAALDVAANYDTLMASTTGFLGTRSSAGVGQDRGNIDLHNDFAWSDRHASSHSTTTGDWSNGYLVNGLASASSSAKVLSL
jgi:hypothetical protein